MCGEEGDDIWVLEGGEDAGFALGIVGRLGLGGSGEFECEGLGRVGCTGFVDGGEEAVG